MLKVRIIPTLLLKGFGLVKGVGFNSWRRVGPLLPSVKVYAKREVDELLLVDIQASLEKRLLDIRNIRDVSSRSFTPLTAGGGVFNISHVENCFENGADKVLINSALYENPNLVDDVAKKYGSQSLLVSVDVKKICGDEEYYCFSHAGSRETGKKVIDWIVELESRGAGEILITSIDRDGTMSGYDLELISKVSTNVKIPVIASGGCGNYQHMIDAVLLGGASAVAAASIFHFTEKTPAEAKKAMKSAGINIRENYRHT